MNENMNHAPRPKATFAEVQQFHKRLLSYLQQLHSYSSSHRPPRSSAHTTPEMDVYIYIKSELKSDVNHFLLSFVPDASQYPAFSDIYIKCSRIIMDFLTQCTNLYYKTLIFCINALLGFESSPYQSEIFVRGHYKRQTKQNNFQFVQFTLSTPSSSTSSSRYPLHRRGKSALPESTISSCQLSVMDVFCSHMDFIVRAMQNKHAQHKIGVFELQKLLTIFYQVGKNAKLEWIEKYFYAHLLSMLSAWIHQLDDFSFGQTSMADDLTYFTQLFHSMEELVTAYVKTNPKLNHSPSLIDRELLTLKLTFCHKLLQCKKMDRRVQALSLLKIVLERARSDDYKQSRSHDPASSASSSAQQSQQQQWTVQRSKKQKQQQAQRLQQQQQQSNNSEFVSPRAYCADFIVQQSILSLLLSPTYLHENLLQRFQPIIDCLCDTQRIDLKLLHALFEASHNRSSVELTHFNRIYLALSKQLDAALCNNLFKRFEERFVQLRRVGQFDESHLEFVAQFTQHMIDKTKSFKFDGVALLKRYAMHFEHCERLALRRFAFKRLCALLRQPCLKPCIPTFIFDALSRVKALVDAQQQADATAMNAQQPQPRRFCYAPTPQQQQQQQLMMMTVTTTTMGGDMDQDCAPDLTYMIEAIDALLSMKQVGKTADRLYSEIANEIFNELRCDIHQLLVKELRYWYWNCSALHWSPPSTPTLHHKHWRRDRARDLKIRFDFLRSFAQKSMHKLDAAHVNEINRIPLLQKMQFLTPPTTTPGGDLWQEFATEIGEIYDSQKKQFLNECVARNNRDLILKQPAIETIFGEQFDDRMDMAGFKSWLGYFRELNKHVYNFGTQQYRAFTDKILDERLVKGFTLMWSVMEQNADLQVVNAMIDELIAVHHAHGIYWSDIHVPRSPGIDGLLDRCVQVFRSYLGGKSTNNPRQELKVLRYALLLRRILEFSVGKRWQSEQHAMYDKKQTFLVHFERLEQSPLDAQKQQQQHYHQQQRRNQQQQQSTTKGEFLQVKVFGSRPIEHLREQIAKQCGVDQPRFVILYRKYNGIHRDQTVPRRFVVVEEHALPFVTYQDLAVKERGGSGGALRIDVQVYVAKNANSTKQRSAYASCCEHFAHPDHYDTLQQLLSSNFNTISLHAFYVLRFLPFIATVKDAILNPRMPQYSFIPFRLASNIYNIDVLRFYTDMDTISEAEKQQKQKVRKLLAEKKVNKSLLTILLDKDAYQRRICGITTLLWMHQLEHILTTLMLRAHYDHGSNSSTSSKNADDIIIKRVIYDFFDQFEEILQALMRALKRLFSVKLPSEQLSCFDVSAPKNTEATLGRCVGHCLSMMIYVIKIKKSNLAYHSPAAAEVDVNPRALERIFIDGLRELGDFSNVVLDGKASIKMAFCKGIGDFVTFTGHTYVAEILNILSVVLANETAPFCQRFMDLLMDLIVKNRTLALPFVPQVLQYVFTKLDKTKDDKTLCSLLDCAAKLYQHLRSAQHQKNNLQVAEMQSHLRFLTDQCLFGAPGTSSDQMNNKPTLLCASNTKSRQKAFEVLYALLEAHRHLHTHAIQQNPKLNLLFAFLDALSKHLHLTSSTIEYEPVADTGGDNEVLQKQHFVGMINLGCTCYLNSVLQQLFMVPSFTNEVLSIDAAGDSQRSTETQLFRELQRVLLTLRESERKFLNPESFARNVRNFAGEPIDFLEQTDCQESLVALFHQLESNLKLLPQYQVSIPKKMTSTTLLDHHFSCTLRYLGKCERGHVTKREEQQMFLNIDVEQSGNLLDGFDKYTEANRLDGDNKYLCSACNEKVAATRRCTIYKPPKQLIVCLKRFKWNFDIGERQKLNTRFEFESQLDIKPYLHTNFPEEESDNDDDDVKRNADDDDDDDEKSKDDAHFMYDLVGIVIHQGSAERGHYYSYIKDRSNDEWFEFNDKNVHKREFGAIQKEAFGGPKDLKMDVAAETNKTSNGAKNRQNPWNKQHLNRNTNVGLQHQNMQLMSDRNAYVLFYEQRAVKLEQKRNDENNTRRPRPWQDVPYLEQEFTKISSENNTIFRQQTLYDSDFVGFMRRVYDKMLPAWNSTAPDAGNNIDLQVLMRFVYNVVPIQCQNAADIKWWWSLLKEKLHRSQQQEHNNKLAPFMTSGFVPSYLVNLFGKYHNACNKQQALQFFEHVIALSAQRPNNLDLLDIFLQKLLSVIEQWIPYKLPEDASMQQIIRLIHCVAQRSEALLMTHGVQIMRALIRLLSIDYREAESLNKHSTPSELWHLLRASETNLAVSDALDLLWRLMQLHGEFEFEVQSEQFQAFLHRVISANYTESQVLIVKHLVDRYCSADNLLLFEDVIGIIHRRMTWLDFYEVYGGLRVFNALLADSTDTLQMAKLQSGCLKRHVQKIMSNLQFWKLSQVCIVTLSQLFQHNALVKGWMQEKCSVELSELSLWCNKHKKFNAPKIPKNNRNFYRNQNNNPYQAVAFYRLEPEYTDKDAHKRLNRWKQNTLQKVQLENDSLLIAIKEIQT